MINRQCLLQNERGYGLIELVAAMPIAIFLLCSLGAVFCLGIKAYVYMLSDWELERQVQFSMEHVRHDLLYALRAEDAPGKLRILCRAASGPAQWVEYELTSETMPRFMRNHQPITGESILGNIRIVEFGYRKQGERTMLFQITAQNLLTGHSYSLDSAVTLPRQSEGS